MLREPGAQAQTQSQVTSSRAQGSFRSNATTTIHIFEDNRLVREVLVAMLEKAVGRAGGAQDDP